MKTSLTKEYLWSAALAAITLFLNIFAGGHIIGDWLILGFSAVAGISLAFISTDMRLHRFLVTSAASAVVYGLIFMITNGLWMTAVLEAPLSLGMGRSYLEIGLTFAFCFFMGSLAAFVIKGAVEIAHRNSRQIKK